MAGRKPKLTPQLHRQIVSMIRAGAFANVAARAAGIGTTTFYNWLQRGAEAKTGMYREFHDEVIQAKAQARAHAEIRVFQEDPLAYLRLGPGRSDNGEPGWTKLVSATPAEVRRAANRIAEQHGVDPHVLLERAEEIAVEVVRLYDIPGDLP